MSEPDLKLANLSIWVSGRQFPDNSDYWDGNWLNLRAEVRGRGSSVATVGPILTVMDFQRFRDEAARLHASLVGRAELKGYEPNLAVELEGQTLGHVACLVDITDDHLSETHRFTFGVDQSYLAALIISCDAILKRFPQVGDASA